MKSRWSLSYWNSDCTETGFRRHQPLLAVKRKFAGWHRVQVDESDGWQLHLLVLTVSGRAFRVFNRLQVNGITALSVLDVGSIGGRHEQAKIDKIKAQKITGG